MLIVLCYYFHSTKRQVTGKKSNMHHTKPSKLLNKSSDVSNCWPALLPSGHAFPTSSIEVFFYIYSVANITACNKETMLKAQTSRRVKADNSQYSNLTFIGFRNKHFGKPGTTVIKNSSLFSNCFKRKHLLITVKWIKSEQTNISSAQKSVHSSPEVYIAQS